MYEHLLVFRQFAVVCNRGLERPQKVHLRLQLSLHDSTPLGATLPVHGHALDPKLVPRGVVRADHELERVAVVGALVEGHFVNLKEEKHELQNLI